MLVTHKRVLTLVAALAVAAAGCQGGDGKAGAAGPTGADGPSGTAGAPGGAGASGAAGPAGEDGKLVGVPTVEGCAVCHGAGREADFAARHARAPIEVSEQHAAVAPNGSDVLVTFTIKVGGVPDDTFAPSVSSSGTTWTALGQYSYEYDPATRQGVRTSISGTSTVSAADALAKIGTFTSLGAGRYSVTLPARAPAAGAARRFLLRLVKTPGADAIQDQATVVADVLDAAGKPAYAGVSDRACANCHGDHVFQPGAHGHGVNPVSASACVVCHVTSSASRGTPGDRLMAYVHGIHASKAMPARDITATVAGAPVTVTKPAGTYARNDSLTADGTAIRSPYSIGFPGSMNNCSTCHDTADALSAAVDAPVSWSLCMSCHDGWDGFTRTSKAYAGADAVAFHQDMTNATACTGCHAPAVLPSRSKARDFHDGLLTERGGLLWAGQDQSVELGKRVALSIDAIAVQGGNLVLTWGAALDGNAVDPCNATAAADAPVFHAAVANAATGMVASNFSVLRTYAQANDWVSAGVASTSPGQPASAVSLTASNTTCSGNVATTTIPAEATTAARGLVALQGKPQLTFAAAGKVIQVRAKSPAREFLVASGAAPPAAEARRAIVDDARCQACHKGSLYQHGGNRVDSVALCVACHNPASSEQQNRLAMGITAANAYDGKAGQTYDLRTMIHAIHSAGETGAPLVYYRNNGVYAFGSQAAIDALKANRGWPGAGSFTVSHSSPATTRTHNEIVVHYPRALADCQACHLPGTEKVLPDPAKAVAVTVNAGAAPWSNQKDDVLMGPVAAACLSCHQSGAAARQAALQGHAFQGGWVPSLFEDGRQSLLDVAR